MRTYVGNSKNSIKRHYICKDGKWDDANYPRLSSSTGINLVSKSGYFLLNQNGGTNIAFNRAKFKNFKRVRFVFRMDIEIGRSPARIKMLYKYPIIHTYNEIVGQALNKVSKQNVYYSFEYDFETMDINLANIQFFFWEYTNGGYGPTESTAKLYDVWFEDASYDK